MRGNRLAEEQIEVSIGTGKSKGSLLDALADLLIDLHAKSQAEQPDGTQSPEVAQSPEAK
jgi:hypothetical protein